jgi:hypothetical protein
MPGNRTSQGFLLRFIEKPGVGLTADESAKDGGDDTTPLRFTVGFDY